jgi:1-acyl-sn-glycerol-3-phosphate acyltransferase
VEFAKDGIRRGRVVYVSNHKSHLDYLIEPLVLDDNGIRPPLLAAGINLFGGALGLLHKHVTGAVPIRRNSKDPLYLVTLRAYVAELLKHRDLLYYAEGGRSLHGRVEDAEDGLLQAALQADREELSVVPVAIAYDLVLEERHRVARSGAQTQAPFGQEVAEMVRHAVGYESRAFVTFSAPIPLQQFEPDSRRDLVTLATRFRTRSRAATKCCHGAGGFRACARTCRRSELISRLEDLHGPAGRGWREPLGRNARQAADEGVPPGRRATSSWKKAAKCACATAFTCVLRAHDRASHLGAAPDTHEDVPTRCLMLYPRRPFPCWPAVVF